ncbi:NF-X1-type zinc finger protein NFXL1-like [Babylonia areolata]|uniref:NF-X1-type zinc finger protein NFXL1-like n=1 Tax=Babylonia areolata TaxID=304850 RepID=UPI003FD4AEA5
MDKPAYLRGRGRGRGSGGRQQLAENSRPGGIGSVGGHHSQHGASHASRNIWASGDHNRLIKKEKENCRDVFAEASSRHQEAVRKHLKEFEDDENSDEEQDDIGDRVLENVFKSYSNNYDSVNEEEGGDVSKAQEHLLHSFRSGTSACLICIDNIKRDDAIWTCKGCFCMLHLQCTQKWVKEGVYQHHYQAEQAGQSPDLDVPWFCPKCRHEYKQSDCPTRSLCFCGKVEDPKFDPWLIPHSCGQTCGRPLKPSCGHSCLLNCHPGPCPPCPKMVQVACCCGGGGSKPRRCNARTWTCGKVCRKTLSCGHHTCEDTCHPGECQPCSKTSVQRCSCGKSANSRPCASPQWHCQEPCGKRLRCGNHLCEEICHSGKCGPCPRAGVRKCPCKKTTFELPCTEDIPTCGDTCGQLLLCGLHTCTQRCHQGLCGQCLQVHLKRCRCSQSQKEVLCSKEYLCEKRCTNLRDCGKHQCKRKCCDGSCPPCEQNCGKTLGCRNHKCPSRCHRGSCYPCKETKDITCFCKTTKITVPCGKEKVTKPPRCNLPCKIRPVCHHPERQKHRCHFGECPACSQVCNLPLPSCLHSCPVRCHDAVKVKVEDRGKKEGPWARTAAYIETVKQPCPPCQVPVPVECMGKHEISQFPCSEVRPHSCGRKCGRGLECGNHTCQLDCHVVHGAPDGMQAGENCQACESACEKARPEGCSHSCLQACHPGACPPCSAMVRMRCHCNAVVKHIPCHEWQAASTDRRNSLKSCGGPCPKMMTCNHQCPDMCHSGSCPDASTCDKKVYLRCACKRRKKEARCCDKRSGETIECDDVCTKLQAQKKQAEEEEAKKKAEEAARKQAADLEEFERHQKGRRKKPRKQREQVVEETFWQKHRKVVLVSLSVLILAVFMAYLFMS